MSLPRSIRDLLKLLRLSSIIICCSCGTGHSIYLRQDNSAKIVSDAYWKSEQEMSEIESVSDFRRLQNGLYQFEIKVIDSLGNYMGEIINSSHFDIRAYDDSLVIDSGEGEAIQSDMRSWLCCGYQMQIATDRVIKQVTNHRRGKIRWLKEKNEVELNANMRRSKNHDIHFVIMFE